MISRVVKLSILSALVLAVTAGPVEAFGKRQATTCYTPIYCPPIYCPPCPCPNPVPSHPVGYDCVKNDTKEYLRITVSGGSTSVERFVAPGECFSFSWRLDNPSMRAVTAFTLNDQLVAAFPFTTLNLALPHDCGPNSHCLRITGTTTTYQKEAPVRK